MDHKRPITECLWLPIVTPRQPVSKWVIIGEFEVSDIF